MRTLILEVDVSMMERRADVFLLRDEPCPRRLIARRVLFGATPSATVDAAVLVAGGLTLSAIVLDVPLGTRGPIMRALEAAGVEVTTKKRGPPDVHSSGPSPAQPQGLSHAGGYNLTRTR